MQRPRMRVAASLVCLALVGFLGVYQYNGLTFGRSASQAPQRRRLSESGGSDCLKEAQCPQQTSCGPQVQTDSLPYSISYSKSASSEATQFTFKVCSKQCSHAASCKPLERFLLRLDSNLLANSEFFKSVSPAGSISQCSEAAGLGYSWSGNQLAALQFHDPAQGEVCQDFNMEIYHESDAFSNLWLTDICQQGVKFIDGNGLLSEPQISMADIGSCIARMTLEDGAAGIQLVADQDFSRSIEPEVDPELKTEIRRVMAELDGPRRHLLQATGYYGYGASPAPYGYYSSPAPARPPVYGGYGSPSPPPPSTPLFGRPATPSPPMASPPPPAYGGYGGGYSMPYSSYGYGSYSSYGYGYYSYGSPAPKAAASAPSPPTSAPSVTLFGPLAG